MVPKKERKESNSLVPKKQDGGGCRHVSGSVCTLWERHSEGERGIADTLHQRWGMVDRADFVTLYFVRIDGLMYPGNSGSQLGASLVLPKPVRRFLV